jgi:rubredoxin
VYGRGALDATSFTVARCPPNLRSTPLHARILPALIARPIRNGAATGSMKAYMCVICGYVYEEEKGDPVSGIAPGTRWEDVPLSWRCPDCGAGKEDFEMVEV